MPTSTTGLKCDQNMGYTPILKGKYDFHVEMFFQGERIGIALVKGVHSHLQARKAALRGIATSIFPMTDRDHVVWASNMKDKIP